MERLDGDLERHNFAYLTTTGRATGKPHRIEIWFVVIDGAIWVNSGGGRDSDWVQNLLADPLLEVGIGDKEWSATADMLDQSSPHPARERLAARYQGWRPGEPLSEWATTSLLIRIQARNG